MSIIDGGEGIQKSDKINPNGPSKLLSICMSGRDDDYMLDFRYRISTTINHFACSIKNLGKQDQVEILVTDWGSNVPMAQTLALSPEAAAVCRFIYVPQDVIRATQEGKDYFHTTRASNSVIRRACGEYILLYPADSLLQEHSFGQMLKMLGRETNLPFNPERTYFMIPRFQAPWQFLERCPNLEEWDRYMLLAAKRDPLEPMNFQFFGGGAGALMMHNELWHSVRGLDENQAGYGAVDVGLSFQVTQEYSYVSLASLGIYLYHMQHPSSGSRQKATKNPNTLCYTLSTDHKSDDWGLGSYTFETQVVNKEHINDTANSLSEDNKNQNYPHLNVSFNTILSQLGSDAAQLYVKEAILSFLKRRWSFDASDLDALFFLSWYSCHFYPHKYLEFTAGMNPAAGVVAKACPHIEMYFIDKWEGATPSYSPRYLVYIREDTSFSGYVRYINGDITTSIDRLNASFIGEFKLDLIYIKGEALGNDAIHYIQRFLEHLTPGGALVFSNNSDDNIDYVWNKLIGAHPGFTFIRSKGHRTGLILKKSMPLTEEEKKSADNICFNKSWIRKLKIYTFFYFKWKTIISFISRMELVLRRSSKISR